MELSYTLVLYCVTLKFPGDFEITWNTHLTKIAGLYYYSQ